MDADALLLNLDASVPSKKPSKANLPKKQWRQQAKNRRNSTGGQSVQKARFSDGNEWVEKQKERAPQQRMTQPGDAAAPAAASEPTIADADEDYTPPLNNEESCILLDALKSACKQEQRLAQECQRDDSDSDPAASPSGKVMAIAKAKKIKGHHSEALSQQRGGDSSRKDRMRSKSSAHVPKAITAELFGTKTGGFEALGIQKVLGEHLAKNNYTKPTAIQQAVLPLLLKGRDVLVRAPTGTGKTLAYLAPMLQQLGTRDPRVSRSDGCRAIIITPTRELTLQVYSVACELAKRYIWLVPGLLIGGENRHHEKQRLRKGVVILVATPGRLLDHLESTTAFSVAHLQWLVLDEADRLLDLGFQKSLSRIVELLEARSAMSDVDRQSVLVSATLHSKLGTIAAELLNDPVAVGLQLQRNEDGNVMLAEDGPAEGQFQLPKSLQQLYMEVPVKMRLPALLGTIRLCFARTPKCKVVVFVATCHGVDFLYAAITDTFTKALKEKFTEHTVCKLHGDMEAGDRNSMMAEFRSCESGMLLCTDVAARGLDFPAVTHIIQNDPPGDVPDYVQRVGRAARMGRRGVALLMLAPQETDYTKALEAVGVAIAQQKLFPSLDALPKPPALSKSAAAEADARRRCFQVAMDAAHHCQARMMDVIAADKQLKARARDAFQSYVGAYATHASHLKSIFHVRKLHLGHVAHSFGLKAQPTSLGKTPAKRKPGKGGSGKGGQSKDGNVKKKRRKAQD